MKIILASNNKKKMEEFQQLLPSAFEIISLKDAGLTEDIPETGTTFADNAMQKARYVFERTNENVIADDSGIEVDALKGAPGVYSARYAGEQRNDEENLQKLLQELKRHENRKANFRCVIALILNGKEFAFDGRVNGWIIYNKKGSNGFGYDPVFVPDGYEETFAEMDADVKNKISHRANAVKKLVAFLKENVR